MKKQLFLRLGVISLLTAGLTHSVLSQQYAKVKIKMTYSGVGWIGVGVSSAGAMVGSVAAIGSGGGTVQKYDLKDKFLGSGGVSPSRNQTLESSVWSQNTTQTVMEFIAPLNWNNGVLSFQSNGNTQMIYAYGSSNSLNYHAGKGTFTVNLAFCLNGANSGDSKCKPDDVNYDQVQVLSSQVKVYSKLIPVASVPAPRPVVSVPKPIVSGSKPVVSLPKPTAPKPKATAPKPAVPIPKPTAPKPVTSALKPTAPIPKPSAPKPKATAPKPTAPLPKPSAPKPKATAPKPAVLIPL